MAGAHGVLQQLAEQWNAPVATSYKGKSAIAETHPLSVGMVGIYGQEAANRAVGDADTVLVVGAKLSPQDTVRERPSVFNPRGQRIIQIDIDDRNAGWTFPVELGAHRRRRQHPGAVGGRIQRDGDGYGGQPERMGLSAAAPQGGRRVLRGRRLAYRLVAGAAAAGGQAAAGDHAGRHHLLAGRGKQPHLDGAFLPVAAGAYLLLSRRDGGHGLGIAGGGGSPGCLSGDDRWYASPATAGT